MEIEEMAGQLMALTHLCAALTVHHPRGTQLLWLLDAHAAEVGQADQPAGFSDGYARVVEVVHAAVLGAVGPRK